jgi:2'-5' RNA ligase
MTGSIRTFFALPIPAPLQMSLAGVQATLRGRPDLDRIRWVRPPNLHVTLQFLVAIPRGLVPELLTAVRAELAPHLACSCLLGEVVLFPHPRRPRVIAVSLEPTAPLEALAAAIGRGVVRTGVSVDCRAFRAHLTLGRVRDRGSPTPWDEDHFGLRLARLPVDRVVLFQSELRADGAVHREIESIPLRAAPAGGLVT